MGDRRWGGILNFGFWILNGEMEVGRAGWGAVNTSVTLMAQNIGNTGCILGLHFCLGLSSFCALHSHCTEAPSFWVNVADD